MTARETTKTEAGRIVTMRDVYAAMSGAGSFAVNYALNQYGKAMAKRIVALILDGHEVIEHSTGNSEGFFVDGAYRSCRDILGRDWWR